MSERRQRLPRSSQQGQVLPLVALMILVLFGFAALAIDVSGAYSLQRFTRAVADAASLAGAQDLQLTGSRSPVTGVMQQTARAHSLESVAAQLGESPVPDCGGTSVDIVDCLFPKTGYRVSIRTPSPSCVDCDPARSVQVTVRQPEYSTTFARVLGATTWNVGSTSVAGLTFRASYGVVTLRPVNTKRNGTDLNRENIDVNGTNTRLFVYGGDIGSNTSVFTNSGGFITLEPGYWIYHIDDIAPDPWNKDLAGNPRGRLLRNQIPDPNYRYPSEAGLATYATQADGTDVGCQNAPGGITPTPTACYRPGIYESDFNVSQNTDVAYLETGVYIFRGNLDVSGSLIGGTESGKPGVVVVVRQDRTFTGNNALLISINGGPASCAMPSCRPGPVIDGEGKPITTTAGLPLSIMVTRDPACFAGITPILCTDNQNDTLTLPGNGQLRVAGVIYAPSDYVKVNGNNSNQTGTLGQLIAWRVSYSGGAQLNQYVASGKEVGVLRLDAACTANEVCNSP